jgi:hypothetical protein
VWCGPRDRHTIEMSWFSNAAFWVGSVIFGADSENEEKKKRSRAEDPQNDIELDGLFAM